ncbi:uncharacterized protein LOC143839991 isoform X1 [Paroedura picta]|uniref:uncharacterized protein LOC143839991 isoform X1 n=1 Tax=Paroedura picta TaxID=143630 RepID=UPI0040567BC7
MVPESLGLWMFLWIQGGVSADDTHGKCKNETGILGKAVELKCCYSGNDLKLNQFRVQWQLKDNSKCVVDAYLPGLAPQQCERYKNRTELKAKYLHLQLLNVTLDDKKTYECIIQKKENGKYQKIFQGWINLLVAANESQNTTYLPSPTPNSVTNDNKQKIVISCLVAAAVIIMIIIWILFKRQHSHHRAYAAPVGVDMS